MQKLTQRSITLVLVLLMSLIVAACEAEVADSPQVTVTQSTSSNNDSSNTTTNTSTSGLLADFAQGNAYDGGWWQVYFTDPQGERDRSLWVNGVDNVVGALIDNTQSTLDIAAFELNNEVITEAIKNAHERGVTVRIVTDDDHGIEDDDSTLIELEAEGIPIVDDSKSALMHNKFIISDSLYVFMGSMNLTQNGVYRNNNNFLILRAPQAVETYQEEFDEMFTDKEFGVRSSDDNTANFTHEGMPIEIYFAAENDVATRLIELISGAQERIYFMTFSFTLDEIGDAMIERSDAGIDVQGMFETVGSGTEFSEFGRMFCGGMNVLRDGSAGILHHKVIIVDNTVITGSFNYSGNATRSNDENVMILTDATVAEQYVAEFQRVQSIGRTPDNFDCSPYS